MLTEEEPKIVRIGRMGNETVTEKEHEPVIADASVATVQRQIHAMGITKAVHDRIQMMGTMRPETVRSSN